MAEKENMIFARSLENAGAEQCADWLVHALCTAGGCSFYFNGSEYSMREGDLLIVRKCSRMAHIRPDADFKVRAIYASPEFIALSAPPQSNYGTRGQLSLYLNPVMRLTPKMYRRCLQDFELVEDRLGDLEHNFHRQALVAAMQMTICDFFDFHAEINKGEDVSSQNASIMFRFIELLENGEVLRGREVAHYADILCITPKYLSEVSNKTSGFSANYWIDRYTVAEISRLLRDKSVSFVEISDRLNFSSPAYLSRYVQQHLGMTPSAYRGDK